MLGKCYLEFNYKTRKERINCISSVLLDLEFVKVKSVLSIIKGVIQYWVMEVTDVFQFDMLDNCIWFCYILLVNINKTQSNKYKIPTKILKIPNT